jgi:hypothetical protein
MRDQDLEAEDPLAFFRGALWALPVCLPFWAGVLWWALA